MPALTESDRPIRQILQDIVGNLQKIIRLEVQLAKAELREDAAAAARAIRLAALGGVLGCYAGGLLLLALVYGLSTLMTPWEAALLVAAVVGAAAAGLIITGLHLGSRGSKEDPK